MVVGISVIHFKRMAPLSLGVFLLVVIFQVEGCIVTWTATQGVVPSGGNEKKVEATSLAACKAQCVKDRVGCVGAAWQGSTCRLYTAEPKGFVSAAGASYYARGPCAVGCNWSTRRGTYQETGQGSVTSAKSKSGCIHDCAADKECSGVDWIQDKKQCWAFITGGVTVARADTDHYEKEVKECVVGCDWSASLKTTRAGGKGVKIAATSLQACQTGCAARKSCVGITWKGSNACTEYSKPGRLVNRNLINGEGYYFVKGKCVEGCSWTKTKDTKQWTGTGEMTNAKSLDGCKADCVDNRDCVGLDWLGGNKCWAYRTNGQLNPEVGTEHYACNRHL